jgi:hypothetical protein
MREVLKRMNNISNTTQVSGESRGCLACCLMGVLAACLLAAGILSASCSMSRDKFDDGTNPMSADSNLLSSGFPSLAALGEATVKALNDSSADELFKLMVTEREFRDVIFARTPDSLKAGLPVEQAWKWNVSESGLAISRKLIALGGKHLTFLGATVKDTTTVFPGKTTYRNVAITAENKDDGNVIEFRFLNVVAMVGGRCKVVAFHK